MSYINRIIASALLVILAVTLYMLAPETKEQSFSLYVSLVSLACLYMNVKYSVRGIWAASSIFMVIFWCFHFGVNIALAMNMDIERATDNDLIWRWLSSPLYPKAEALAILGLAAFALITVVRSNDERTEAIEKEQEKERDEDRTESPHYKPLKILAYIFLVGGIGYWTFIMMSMGGVAALFAGYGTYLMFVENYPIISLIYWGIGVGITMLGVIGNKKDILPGVILFAVWGAIAFVIGLRGDVMYPASAFIVCYARQVKLNWKPRYALVVVVILSMISFVREYRVDGTVNQNSFNPVFGLIEMGGSLQTVVIVQDWVSSGIDKFRYGATLYGPVERIIDRVTLVPVDNSLPDTRQMNVMIMERNGPYGFSPIAEGFINMGAMGVVILMVLLSLFLNFYDTRPASVLTDSYLGGITYILFTFIRNSFTHIPGQCLLLAVTLTIVYAFFKRKQ